MNFLGLLGLSNSQCLGRDLKYLYANINFHSNTLSL
jgi:hypothetical protein